MTQKDKLELKLKFFFILGVSIYCPYKFSTTDIPCAQEDLQSVNFGVRLLA